MLVQPQDDSSDMSDVAPDMPKLELDNHALPVGLRSTSSKRTDRNTAKRVVMDMLYSGAWRYSFPFCSSYAWFVTWLLPHLRSNWQGRHTETAAPKVSTAAAMW